MKIIDLSHRLTPGKQRFKLNLRTFSVGEYIPEYNIPVADWYIMEDIEMCTHVGTHVESPLHAIKDGTDVINVDFRRMVGEAAVIEFTDKSFNEPMRKQEFVDRGKHIKQNDIVLIKTGLSKHYGTPDYRRPFVETSAVDWLIDRNIKCVGIDCSGIENRAMDTHQINHIKLFSNGIPLIEDLNNLDELSDNRVFLIAFPMKIEGLDASPLRPIAIEPCEAGSRIFNNVKTVWVGFNGNQ